MSKELYEQAIETWGQDAQIFMAVEEMAELTHALMKSIRGRGVDNISEEIADVEIMLEQLKLIFDEAEFSEVAEIKAAKLKRLAERLKQVKDIEVAP